MPNRFSQAFEQRLIERLRFYEEIGIGLFYRNRRGQQGAESPVAQEIPATASEKHVALPKPAPALPLRKPLTAAVTPAPKVVLPLVTQGPSLFEAAERIEGDTLERIRTDIGDCTRCRLCRGRINIVFGDGNPTAPLVFVGEGPGHDEDVQGLPFVGRAGKLLTQMIEAMGLERKAVYICNVIKCRPPENRTPEKDEVATCSPFLLRQLDVIRPKVIVCLGSVAAQTLLNTHRGISHYRGEWLEYRGARLMATYHPAYLLRNPGAKGEVWKDLQKVMAVLGLTARKGKPA